MPTETRCNSQGSDGRGRKVEREGNSQSKGGGCSLVWSAHEEDGAAVLRGCRGGPHVLVGGASSAHEAGPPVRGKVVICDAVRSCQAQAAIYAVHQLQQASQ